MNIAAAQSILDALTRRNDITLAAFVVTIVIMMILPMPTFIVDVLITFNMTLAIVMLMISVYIESPLSFSAFPSVLLLATLFRLALSITTTRLILLQGDAGSIVTTFGNFVVGGNIVVGVVIFLIITLVQFIVITKGAERVAEVSARFSLDAMPGKQMSIDSDMRAGMIDGQEARLRRKRLEKESQLYGSMDGAMKFVKGDAIAGIFIILINIIGGISIGTLQKDMTMSAALELYTILTVGDGLVAQIPALFIAITSGIIVTRVNTEEKGNLGSDISKQVLAQPKALLIGAAVLLFFSFIPGFPTSVFLTFSFLMGGIGMILLTFSKQVRKQQGDFIDSTAKSREQEGHNEINIDSNDAESPLTINMHLALQAAIKGDALSTEFARVKKAFNADLGVPFPGVHIQYNDDLIAEQYEINLHNVPIATGHIRPGFLLVSQKLEKLAALAIPTEPADDFLPEQYGAVWVFESHKAVLSSEGIEFLDNYQILGYHLAKVLRRYAEEFIGIHETSQLIEKLKPSCSNLVKEAMTVAPLPIIGGILQRLVGEGVSIRNLKLIMEAILKHGKDEKDPAVLAEHARAQLRRQISFKHSHDNKEIQAVLLDMGVENTVRKSIKSTQKGSYLAMDPNLSRQFIESIKKALADVAQQTQNPILITSVDVRRFVSNLIKPYLPNLPVLSYQELTPEIFVKPVGRINMNVAASNVPPQE